MSDLIERLEKIGYNTGEVDAGTISRLIPECAKRLRKLEAVREAAGAYMEHQWDEPDDGSFDRLEEALAACGDDDG